ncbi:hypothetical protein JCGZ_04139 [Jatropha curcas]|uniref:Transmembrane protein n=1 Tax=Jatropha curcas TaxID=180498 RepID=A0A067L4P7_JATCU|nr:hypothetical protein JCGZ_04139 [Jatropha curcas]
MIPHRYSFKLLKPFCSNYVAKNIQPKSYTRYSNSSFTQQTKPGNPNSNFYSFECQTPTQQKTTNLSHSFLNFAAKSKNHDFIRSRAEEARLFSSSLISDLKLKEITLANTLLKTRKPRHFSSSDSSSDPEKPQNPCENQIKIPNFSEESTAERERDRDVSALANETILELRKIVKKTLTDSMVDAYSLFVVVGLANWICYKSGLEIAMQNMGLENTFQNLLLAFNIMGCALTIYVAVWWMPFVMLCKKLEEEIKMMEKEGHVEGLTCVLQSVKEHFSITRPFISCARTFWSVLLVSVVIIMVFFD